MAVIRADLQTAWVLNSEVAGQEENVVNSENRILGLIKSDMDCKSKDVAMNHYKTLDLATTGVLDSILVAKL